MIKGKIVGYGIGESIRGILPSEYKWIHFNGLILEEELRKTTCKNTRLEWNGDTSRITIACIDKPLKIVWWYTGTKCYPRLPYNFKK